MHDCYEINRVIGCFGTCCGDSKSAKDLEDICPRKAWVWVLWGAHVLICYRWGSGVFILHDTQNVFQLQPMIGLLIAIGTVRYRSCRHHTNTHPTLAKCCSHHLLVGAFFQVSQLGNINKLHHTMALSSGRMFSQIGRAHV